MSAIRSPRLGDIEWEPQSELFFPWGLPGFEDEQRMIPVEIPAHRPMVYLQSARNADVCFLCLPVLAISSGFQLCLSDEESAVILLAADCQPVIGDDVLCLGLLVPAGSTVEANLSAPVVINLHTSRGVQCVSGPQARNCFRLEQNGAWEEVVC